MRIKEILDKRLSDCLTYECEFYADTEQDDYDVEIENIGVII